MPPSSSHIVTPRHDDDDVDDLHAHADDTTSTTSLFSGGSAHRDVRNVDGGRHSMSPVTSSSRRASDRLAASLDRGRELLRRARRFHRDQQHRDQHQQRHERERQHERELRDDVQQQRQEQQRLVHLGSGSGSGGSTATTETDALVTDRSAVRKNDDEDDHRTDANRDGIARREDRTPSTTTKEREHAQSIIAKDEGEEAEDDSKSPAKSSQAAKAKATAATGSSTVTSSSYSYYSSSLSSYHGGNDNVEESPPSKRIKVGHRACGDGDDEEEEEGGDGGGGDGDRRLRSPQRRHDATESALTRQQQAPSSHATKKKRERKNHRRLPIMHKWNAAGLVPARSAVDDDDDDQRQQQQPMIYAGIDISSAPDDLPLIPARKRFLVNGRRTTPYRGVYPVDGGYTAVVIRDNANVALGTFDTAEEAAAVYAKATFVLNPPPSSVREPKPYALDLSNAPDDLPLIPARRIMNNKKKNGTKTSYRGVYEDRGGRYRASISIDGRNKFLGIFDTPEEAARVFAKAYHVLYSSPTDGDGNDDDGSVYGGLDLSSAPKDLPPVVSKRRTNRHNKNKNKKSSDDDETDPPLLLYQGVTRNGDRFYANIAFDGESRHLGAFDSAKEAGVVYARAAYVVEERRNLLQRQAPSSTRVRVGKHVRLDLTRAPSDLPPVPARLSHGRSRYMGVYRDRGRYKACVAYDGANHHLGTYRTPEEAAVVFAKATWLLKRRRFESDG